MQGQASAQRSALAQSEDQRQQEVAQPRARVQDPASDAVTSAQTAQRLGTFVLIVLFVLPFQLWTRYTTLVEQLQDESTAARALWEGILAADPPANAILVSNDRNEIVPLFYLQTVENRARGSTGLFPLIAPDARFADIGTTVQTALDAGASVQPNQPVYLIKPMHGLEARFALAPANPPLVQVTGPAAAAEPAVAADAVYGPLRLLGYDMQPAAALTGTDTLTDTVTLHWQVTGPLPGDYTTTVQLFDAAGSKLAQDDRRAGGDYYPTTLWKPGEVILDRHTLALPAGAQPTRLLVGMYTGPDAALLAPPLELECRLTPLPGSHPSSRKGRCGRVRGARPRNRISPRHPRHPLILSSCTIAPYAKE